MQQHVRSVGEKTSEDASASRKGSGATAVGARLAERVRQEQRRVELLDAGQCRGGRPS